MTDPQDVDDPVFHDPRPQVMVHAEAPSDDAVRTFYEIPDELANIVRNGWPGRTFNEALALKLGGQVPMVDEPVPEHEVDPRDIADTDHFNPYLRDDGSNVLSDAWDDGYAAGYAAAKPPGYVVQTQAEVDRLLNEAEALRIERDAAREDLAACRQFAADHVERAARQNIVARVANGPYTLLVTGDSYEQILESAEAWVEGREGRRFTPTYYTALTSVLWRGVVGTIDEEEGVGTDG